MKTKLKDNNNVIILDQWFPTTKHCFQCDTDTNIDLSQRIYQCSNCNNIEDRDIHAAKNMIEYYLRYKSVGTPDSKPIKKVSYNSYKKLCKIGSSMVLDY